MHWTDFVTLALITLIITIVIPAGPTQYFACAVLGISAGIYRGRNPWKKK